MTAPAETDTATHVLTDEGFPIGWSVIADRPELAYLADPEASRPATAEELAALEEHAYEEYAAAKLAQAAVGTIPRGPWPVAKAPEPEPAAVTVVDQPAADPGPIHCDCQDDAPAQPEDDPAPVLNPIAELALSRFESAHDAEDERTATTQLAAVGDDTAVIEGEAK